MEKMSSQAYHYKISNGILIVNIELNKHIPSHLTIGGYGALVSYGGQPPTCYVLVCNASGHLIQHCPKRHRPQVPEGRKRHKTWANIIAREEETMQDTSAVVIPPRRDDPSREDEVKESR